MLPINPLSICEPAALGRLTPPWAKIYVHKKPNIQLRASEGHPKRCFNYWSKMAQWSQNYTYRYCDIIYWYVWKISRFMYFFFVSRIERMPSRTTDEAMEESFSKEDNKNFHQISDNAEEKFTFKMRMHNNLLRLWVHGLCHNILHELHLHVILQPCRWCFPHLFLLLFLLSPAFWRKRGILIWVCPSVRLSLVSVL